EQGWTLVPKQHRSPHLLGALSKRGVSEDFVGKLAEQNIFVSYRGGSLRIAPHLHINEQDLERFLRVLSDS
ncbi:MAG: aminotransferase, partial [bacterium]